MAEHRDRLDPRPRDPGQPGQSDGRGRRRPGRRRASAARAVPSGASTGSREAIELRDGDKGRYLGKGVTAGGRGGQRRDRATRSPASTRSTRPRSTRRMIELDGTENKEPARRQRDPRRQPRRRQGRRRSASACRSTAISAASAARVLPVPMMNMINGGAHADNPIDIQEFMILPVGRRELQRGAAHGRRDLPCAEEGCSRTPATTPTSATRAASRPISAVPTRRWASSRRRVEAAGYRLGEDVVLRPRRGRQRVLQGRQLPAGGRGQDARCRGHGRAGSRACASATRSSRSRTAWPRTTGTAGSALTETLGAQGPAGRRRPVRHQPGDPGRGHRAGRRQPILIKVNQIGTLTETLEAVELAHRAGYSLR